MKCQSQRQPHTYVRPIAQRQRKSCPRIIRTVGKPVKESAVQFPLFLLELLCLSVLKVSKVLLSELRLLPDALWCAESTQYFTEQSSRAVCCSVSQG